ncbi:hypothetical protein HGM15179_003914 [Zosterops borbonicus]|uniref:Uncharacterized protein n=1 Tax=Zosterops borbonicus TaxID=364589 RepID=A0A8K1GSA9_9PASS|nr:hypothetical protein HGM15179_003914 [Zosterops borbonicus]
MLHFSEKCFCGQYKGHSSANTKVSAKCKEEVLQAREQIPLQARGQIPLQTVVNTKVKQLCPCCPGRSIGELLEPLKAPMLEQVSLWEAHSAPVLLAGPMEPWREGSTLEQVCCGTCDPTRDEHWSSLCLKDCRQWRRPTLEKLVKTVSHVSFPHAGTGEECEGKEWQIKCVMNIAFIPHVPAL